MHVEQGVYAIRGCIQNYCCKGLEIRIVVRAFNRFNSGPHNTQPDDVDAELLEQLHALVAKGSVCIECTGCWDPRRTFDDRINAVKESLSLFCIDELAAAIELRSRQRDSAQVLA